MSLTAAPQESDGQHAERKGAAGEDHRLAPREPLDLGEELVRIALAHVPTDALELLGASIDILREHRLGAFLAEVLAGLAERLGDARHRIDEVLLAHVEPRRHLVRDLLGGLIHDRGRLAVVTSSLRRPGTLTHAHDATRRLLNLVDDLAGEMVRSVPDRGL